MAAKKSSKTKVKTKIVTKSLVKSKNKMVKKVDPTEVAFNKIVSEIDSVNSYIPVEKLKQLQELADPKLRVDLSSQLFYLRKMKDSSEYGTILKDALAKVSEYLPDLPFERVLLLVETLSGLKVKHDADITSFLVESKKAEAQKAKAQRDALPGNGVVIDKLQINNPVVNKLQQNIEPSTLNKILELADEIIKKDK